VLQCQQYGEQSVRLASVVVWCLSIGVKPGPAFSRCSAGSMGRGLEEGNLAAILGKIDRNRAPYDAYITAGFNCIPSWQY